MNRIYGTLILVVCTVFLLVGCATSKKAETAKAESTTTAKGTLSKDEKAPKDKEEVEVVNEVAERKWEEHARVKLGIVYFYEKETITYPAHGVIRVWRKRELPDRMADKAIISQDEIDCKNEKYRSVFLQVIRKNDTIDTFKKPSEDWATVYPDSPEEYFMDHFCKEANKAK